MTTRYQTQTDVTVYFVVIDSTTRARVTSGSFSDFALSYGRPGSAAVTAITEVTQTAAGAHVDWGIAHWWNGIWRVDVADAVCLAGVERVLIDLTRTGCEIMPVEVELPVTNPFQAGYSGQDLADFVRTLILIRGQSLGKILDVVVAILSGENNTAAGGTQAAPKFNASDNVDILVETTSALRDNVTVNWGLADP